MAPSKLRFSISFSSSDENNPLPSRVAGKSVRRRSTSKQGQQADRRNRPPPEADPARNRLPRAGFLHRERLPTSFRGTLWREECLGECPTQLSPANDVVPDGALVAHRNFRDRQHLLPILRHRVAQQQCNSWWPAPEPGPVGQFDEASAIQARSGRIQGCAREVT